MKKLQAFFAFISIVLFLIASNSLMISCSDDDDDDDATPTPTLTPTPTSTPDADIIPGLKMIDLYIHDSFSSCTGLYGEPDMVDCTSISGVCVVYYYVPSMILFVLDENNNQNLDDSELINSISTVGTAYDGTTAGGNGLGSSRSSVINEFGPCEEPLSNDDLCSYLSIGIQWYYYDNQESCDAITVMYAH